MIKIRMVDGRGRLFGARVNPEGSLQVVPGPGPGIFQSVVVPFSQFLTVDGTPSGSSQMAITTGTLAAPVNFFIPSHPKHIRFITTLGFFISGAAANLNEFGTGPALTNGVVLKYLSDNSGEVQLGLPILTNFDLVRLCLMNPAFGTGSSGFQVLNAVSADEAFVPVMDLARIVPPYGIQLDPGSSQKLIISIRDNTLTARASAFNCLAYGFDRIVPEGESL